MSEFTFYATVSSLSDANTDALSYEVDWSAIDDAIDAESQS